MPTTTSHESVVLNSWGVLLQSDNSDIPERITGTLERIEHISSRSVVEQMRIFRKWRKSKDDGKADDDKVKKKRNVDEKAKESSNNSEKDNLVDYLNVQQEVKDSEGSSSGSSNYGSEAEDYFLSDGLEDDLFTPTSITKGKEQEPAEHINTHFEVLSKLPFFAQFTPEHRQQLFENLIVESFEDGDLIVQQGTKGDRMYVIIEGEVSIWKQLEGGITEDITYIYSPDFFGELSLLYGDERVANVSAVGNTTVMYLTKEAFEQTEEIRMFLYVSKVPFLKKLNKESQLQVVRLLTPVSFEKGEQVVVQGEIGDAFYMITAGSADVIENGEATVKLYDGHTFGQMALLSDSPRLATVQAREHLTCLKLTAANFKKLLKDSGNSDFSKLLTQDDKQIRRRRSKREQQKLSASKLKGRSRPFSHSIDDYIGREHSSNSVVEEQRKVTQLTKHGKKVINGYVILEKIGSGTFGVVRKCKNESTKTIHAIKIIDKKRFKSDELQSKYMPTLDDMRKEVAIMKRLVHPNVVNLNAVFDDPMSDSLYIITEYCSKGAIMEDLEDCAAFSESKARKYFRDMLHGLEYLHFQNVIHRDIKPMNLLLTEDDVVKIADFGAARMLMGDQKWVAGVAGTPAFMAPELLSENKDIYSGEPVDLWSCGATLYMFVTGSPPWMSDDELQLAKKVKNDELLFPKEEDIKLSPYVKNMIKGLLMKDPTKRMTLLETMRHDWVTDENSDPLEIMFADREHSESTAALLPTLTAEEETGAIEKAKTSHYLSRGSSMTSSFVKGVLSNASLTGRRRGRASTFDIELGDDTVYVEHPNIDSDDERSVKSDYSSSYALAEEDIGRIESFHRDRDDMLRVRVKKDNQLGSQALETTKEESGTSATATTPAVFKTLTGKVCAKHGKHIPWCGLRYGVSSDIGEKSTLEDTTSVVHKLFAKSKANGTKYAFYAGLFDGHGGDLVSKYLAENMHKVIVDCKSFPEDLSKALRSACLRIDRTLLQSAASYVVEHNRQVSAGEVKQKLLRTKAGSKGRSILEQYRGAGSTGVLLLLTKKKTKDTTKERVMHFAWVGDSRAVLSQKGRAIQLSQDHKADREDEKKRIRAAGGTVDRSGRLNGVLAVSRAFGDLSHKAEDVASVVNIDMDASSDDESLANGPLTAIPDVMSRRIDEDMDEFVVIASDGLFDVFSNEQVVGLVRKELQDHQDVQKAAQALVKKAVGEAGAVDNTTAIVVAL